MNNEIISHPLWVAFFVGNLIGNGEEADFRVRKNASVYTRAFFFERSESPRIDHQRSHPLLDMTQETLDTKIKCEYNVLIKCTFYVKRRVL